MKLIILMVLLLALAGNTTFAACEPATYAQFKELDKDELAKMYCETVEVWRIELKNDEETLKAGINPNGRKAGQCYKTKELILRAYKSKFKETIKCEGDQE